MLTNTQETLVAAPGEVKYSPFAATGVALGGVALIGGLAGAAFELFRDNPIKALAAAGIGFVGGHVMEKAGNGLDEAEEGVK